MFPITSDTEKNQRLVNVPFWGCEIHIFKFRRFWWEFDGIFFHITWNSVQIPSIGWCRWTARPRGGLQTWWNLAPVPGFARDMLSVTWLETGNQTWRPCLSIWIPSFQGTCPTLICLAGGYNWDFTEINMINDEDSSEGWKHQRENINLFPNRCFVRRLVPSLLQGM